MTKSFAAGMIFATSLICWGQPTLTCQPTNQTAIAGSTVTFTVCATGTPPLSYQWRSHANATTFTNIPWGTEATLVLTDVQPTQRRFGVVVTDAGGLSATSTLATLTVYVPPSIIAQPARQAAFTGDTVTFSVMATGIPAVAYQWLFNNSILPGKTTSNLILVGIQSANVGAYAVVVTNVAGAITSQVASLTLITPGVPHQFVGISVAPVRTISLMVSGSVALAFKPYFDLYPVDVSSNLLDWERFATMLLTNAVANTISFQDTEASRFTNRFYRTVTNHFPTPFPRPTGPHAVGRVSRLLTDPSRTNRYNIPTNSSFMVTFWYPAQAQAGLLPSEFVEKVIALDGGYYAEYTNVVPQFRTVCLSNAPIAAAEAPYPVLIYSHGLTSLRIIDSQRCEELASHGYIVAAPAHIDCYAQVFPDGREVFGSYTDESSLFQSRIVDMRFFLDRLVQFNASDPMLGGRMDLDRIGALGFSFGAGTAAEICRIDSRVKAALLLDGYLVPASSLNQAGLQKPFLSMNSEFCEGDCPNTQALFQRATTNAYWFQMRGTVHGTFSNGAWFRPLTSTSRPAAAAMNACALSFVNKYLKNQDDHLLDNPVAVYPTIFNFQSK